MKKEMEIEALPDNFEEVVIFVEDQLEGTACTNKVKMQLKLAIEEIFVNIAHYAYGEETGTAKVVSELDSEQGELKVRFIDQGIPFDPLKKEDPNTNLTIEDRQVGGLGIFLVKKLMDKVEYEYSDGCNILTITKCIL